MDADPKESSSEDNAESIANNGELASEQTQSGEANGFAPSAASLASANSSNKF